MRQFFVYAVELRRPRPDSYRVGIGFRAVRPAVYVGSSAFTPEERFHKHMTDPGMASSRHVRRFGVRLLPNLYRHMNPLHTREEAKAAEQALRRNLEARGYQVFGSCQPHGLDCKL